jgi:thiol:disulfide interchange protein DsbC
MISRLLIIALSLLLNNAFADEKDIVKSLGPYIPSLQETDVVETPIQGIYEVIITNPKLDILYISGDGRFIVQGDIIDFENGSNITKRRLASLAKHALLGANQDDMIVYPAEKEEYVINVFTDVDCPYCRKLHNDLDALNELGITIKYLAFPRSGVNTKSFYKSVSIWCSDNRKQSMDLGMLQKDVPSINCDSPVVEHLNLAQDFGVSGTPYIFFENGANIPGYVEPKALLQEIKRSLAKFN